jgi:3-(methylthio)propanoyl-CoA dehydrogenase
MYRAPLQELRFVLNSLLPTGQLAALPRYADYSSELADSVLTEAGRFAEAVLDPINGLGDRDGARWTADGVRMPAEFRRAYEQFIAAGWTQLSVDPADGGQGAPLVLATAAEEIWFSANIAFMLCPQLGRGAIEALALAGSEALRAQYLPRMISGEWSGTMNLTESQAGSDLAAIRTRAKPEGDHYLISGQKIFITYGDHDLTANIVHLVLARIDGAPAGVKGISLFVVPKFLPGPGSVLGARNDVKCVSIEHKLGIHASPTCVMSYGDGGGASGFLIGEPNRGLEYMFIMMNSARLAVGLQGVGLAERARQQATEWAHTRIQGRPVGTRSETALPIIYHPDVRRMLLTIKSGVEAIRALSMYTALQLDLGRALPDAAARASAQARGELLIPIAKAWSTEQAQELISLAVQIHGGMGFIEETGIAQTLRDVRITSIYEGTTGIQANDLLGRKLGRDHGAAMRELLAEIRQELGGYTDPAVAALGAAALEALSALEAGTTSLLATLAAAPADAYAVSVPYLKLCGIVLGGWLAARAAAIATDALGGSPDDAPFLRAKVQTANFYAAHRLPQALALARVVQQGATAVTGNEAELI